MATKKFSNVSIPFCPVRPIAGPQSLIILVEINFERSFLSIFSRFESPEEISSIHNNGLNLAATLGLQLVPEYYGAGFYPSLHVALNYQWKISQQGFLSLGLCGGMFWLETYNYYSYYDYYYDYYYWDNFYTTEAYPYIIPTISYDYRF